MLVRGTDSSQTVCQMPDCAVYQIPPRSSFCLPRLWYPVSLMSRTRTTISCAASGEPANAPVTSRVKGR